MKKTTKKIKRVAIFGDGEARQNDRHFKDAAEVARLLAKNGYIIVNGGGPGVMRAATLGAKEGGGKVEVVIVNPSEKIGNYEGVDEENLKMADKIIKADTYDSRLSKLVEIADAFVFFKGGTGTISEMGLAWSKAKFDYGHHEPLIFFGKFWKEIIGGLMKGLGLEEIEKEVVVIVDKTEDVMTSLK